MSKRFSLEALQPDRKQARSLVRRVVTWLLLLIVLFLLYRMAPMLVSDRVFQIDDFLEYWSAGRLNQAGHNPYDPQLMESVQRELGRARTIMMYNPPFALALAMPVGLLSYPLARIVWLLVGVATVAIASAWLWELAGGARSRIFLIWILAFTFMPTLRVLGLGQLTPFMLLGLAGFLRCQKSGRFWAAGAFAALIALKPHWLLLFWLVLLLWSIDKRQWKTLLAAAGMLVAATGVALLFNPAVVSQYLFTATHEAPTFWWTPTIGGALRGWFGAEKTWLQFAPVIAGVLWALVYWWQHRADWDWVTRLPAIVFASVITAIYGWTFDLVVLLVPLISAIYLMTTTPNRRATVILGSAGLVFNLGSLIIRGFVTAEALWWLAPAWLIWYVLVRHYCSAETADLSAKGELRPAS